MRLTLQEFRDLINPIERPTRTWHCGFGYLETWLANEAEDIEYGIELNPDFQRGHVWSEQQQRHYIENILRGLVDEGGLTIRFNCPSWRNDISDKTDLPDQLVCIDGLQRLTAIRKFISGELCVFCLSWDVLPKRLILRDLQVVVKMYDFQFRKELLQFYLDINGGGTAHTSCELNRVRELLEKAA